MVCPVPSECAETVFSDNNSGSGSLSTMCHKKNLFFFFYLILLALICRVLKCNVYFCILLLIAYSQAVVGEGTLLEQL